MYDFTTLRPRRGIGASKWQPLERAGVADPDVIPFSIADMDLITAPEIISALREAAEFGVYGYTIADGPYKQAVCRWMARRHHWTVEPEWMFQTFGVVPANFRQVEAPQVYATVYAWLTGGSQFVNQADVGGVYNGQWIMATSRWVTKVYKPAEPLPRTGY